MPWRDGGRRKQRRSEWRKQAMHAVAELAALAEPLTSLPCRGPYWERPKHLIYRLDQELARAGIAYYPEYGGRWRGFTIYVTAGDKDKVREMIARLVGAPGG